MLYFINDDTMATIKEVLFEQIDLMEGDEGGVSTREKLREIIKDLNKQSDDNELMDKIASYKCMRNLSDAVFECFDDVSDIKKHLPEGKTVSYVLIIDDAIPEDDEEEDGDDDDNN